MRLFVAHTFLDQPLLAEFSSLLGTYGHEVIDPFTVDWTEAGLGEISRLVQSADVVIAILSERPQNVLFELGLAVGSGRPVVIAAASPHEVPADARSAPFVLTTGNVREDAAQLMRRVETISPPPTTLPKLSGGTEETLHNVADSPAALASLGPRDLESLLAAFLGSEDFEVQPAGDRAGGYDFALAMPGTQQKLLVEVKAFGRHNRVSVESVRRLAGAVKAVDAAGGLMISTSPYSPAALAFAASNGVVLMTLSEVLDMQAGGSTVSFSVKALELVRSGRAKALIPPSAAQESGAPASGSLSIFDELSLDAHPTSELLSTTRNVAHGIISDLGGSPSEAEIVADSVVAYVDLTWRLTQAGIASDERRWRRHVVQIALRHWFLSVRDAELPLHEPEVRPRQSSRPKRQASFAISTDDLAAIRRLAINTLATRGYPRVDAEDVAQDVLAKIVANPQEFAERVAALPEHRGYFATMAMNSYLMRLRAEMRRRDRERVAASDEGGFSDSVELAAQDFDASALLTLIPEADLTPRQREYILDLLINNNSIEDIATREGTTQRAVRAVLMRAATRLRHHIATKDIGAPVEGGRASGQERR